MERDEPAEARWSVDLEATVAKNVCLLRESRGISQQQLGADLFNLGMHQEAVARLEAGTKPLRLNEVAAIALYFEVPIEFLWRDSGEIPNELLAGFHAAEADAAQVVADYYTQQRLERLRDKQAEMES